ncbi:hypothetical protein PanWU01x14_012780 [Parasponia andersonii]|uniref:Uncharacterized protein n=1 Tax=Parasponia andersonii TaxID=3476 RepID=A0A2P5E0U4_PARAD|nr:hypothetical protein PanWU01x14_012780 [Parasponia andersonii]
MVFQPPECRPTSVFDTAGKWTLVSSSPTSSILLSVTTSTTTIFVVVAVSHCYPPPLEAITKLK